MAYESSSTVHPKYKPAAPDVGDYETPGQRLGVDNSGRRQPSLVVSCRRRLGPALLNKVESQSVHEPADFRISS